MAAPGKSISGFPDVEVLRQMARGELVDLLKSMPGKKDLVIEPSLMRPLDRIAGASLLKENGIEKIFKLEPKLKCVQGSGQRIYLVRPEMLTMKQVADHINADIAVDSVQKKYKILMVPRKLHVCEQILEQEGVHGYVTIEEFQLDFIPLDTDLVSLELPEFTRSCLMDGDQSWSHTIAKSLVNLQTYFGIIPNVYGHGKNSKMVFELMQTMFEYDEPKQINHDIGNLFLIDRDIDFVTPLCSQMTYEGLLDDIFSIDSGFVEFGSEVTGTEKSVKLLLSSQDMVYQDIRNKHFSMVFSYLSNKAKELQTGYDKRHNLASVSDMKNFVQNDLKDLKQQHKSLTLHIGACEVILNNKTKGGDFEEQMRTEHSLLEGVEGKENYNYLEECINRQYNVTMVLRLLCLMSLTQDGLSSQNYKTLKTQLLQSHGFEFMLTFFNLKKLGLLTEKQESRINVPQTPGSKHLQKMASIATIPKKSSFQAISKKLNLVPKAAEEVDLKNPNDMSYVYSGAYTPIIPRLVEQVLQKDGWSHIEDVIKLLPGSEYNFSSSRAKSAKGKGGGSIHSLDPSSKVVCVYFIGGCTYSEIAALRYLGKMKGYKFLIATTGILSGNRLIELLTETPSI
ncbi:unnamed protein product [Owenia fusiformis]|uniref:Vacuolar protein sorting-associated protein 33B n=1 Tax=Owenia fusiformis TaxID=6347 RepID=A0A8J1XTB8_OWEFU|nr:unnamed protein product [Owenia fusiformis]CAH1796199.1 unnamed protein product [Owenia fusiformis]